MTTCLTQASAVALATVLAVGTSGIPVAAQVQTQVCESQQSMEQVMETEGALAPDDCRPATITRLQRDTGDICVIDVSGADSGVVDELLAVARTDQWWIACEDLAEVMQRAP
jgi:pyrimidine operon attenuation protein/uracil phosphoribosyltransferase